MNEFVQTPPTLGNTWTSDPVLRGLLKRTLPEQYFREIDADLERFGERAATDLLALSEAAEANPPYLVNYDAWGNRIDKVVTSDAWNALHAVSAEEGIVAIGYERKYGEYSRLYQFAKLFLFHPSSAYYTCPLAMTDGAAKLIETYGDNALKQHALARLTSRDPVRFWTSGQWMTERSGGSDVGQAETIARRDGDIWRLYGVKWFVSAITSQMGMTLARIEDANGDTVAGSRGLSLFYVEPWDEPGRPERFEIMRLKDKLGTRALPTAEIRLDGTPATLVGEPGEGVKTISTLFNITRMYNACTTMGAWRRLLDLAKDYAAKRTAFGKPLEQHPLHARTLREIETEYRGCFHLVMYVAELLGREEAGLANNNALLRLLTPVAKLYCAKKNLAATTELIECFGGAGYLEDTGIPKWLRDNQVLTIWEGTTNVLSLDVLRAIAREDALVQFIDDVQTRTSQLPEGVNKTRLAAALARLEAFAGEMTNLSRDELEYHARDLAFSLARVMSASLLAEYAASDPDAAASAFANAFCETPLIDFSY